jgi:hypothetical protein
MMKVMRYISCLIFAAVMTLSVSAFAKTKDSGKFRLEAPARVGNTQLQPGEYEAKWSGPADALKIEIVKDGKVVATTSGQIKNLDRPSPYNDVATKTLPDQTQQLNEIDFSNQKQALVVGGM